MSQPIDKETENSLRRQIFCLEELFPEIQDGYVDFSFLPSSLPLYAEDWFVIPRWDKIFDSYKEAVFTLFERFVFLKNERYLIRALKYLNNSNIRKTRRSLIFWERTHKFQSEFIENFVVVPAQFGSRHISRSPCEVRRLIKNLGFEGCNIPEFGLGVFEVGCMILTHPSFLDDFNYSGRWIHCVGDILSETNFSPIFYKDKRGYLIFTGGPQSSSFGHYVSATGFYLHY